VADGGFVVFLIGARLQAARRLVSPRSRRPSGMQHMLAQLTARPEVGLLGYEMAGLGTIIVQHWQSFDHLQTFAKGPDTPHVAAWRNYWRRFGKSTRTDIWHETYLVSADAYEAVLGNMAPFGLGNVARPVAIVGSVSARQRLRTATTPP